MVEARGVDGFLDVHPEIHDIEDHLKHGIDDPAPTGCADHHEELPVLGEDRRSHAREHSLPRGREVRFGADEPLFRREARPRVEVPHLVVQEEPRAGDDDLGSVPVFQRIRQ